MAKKQTNAKQTMTAPEKADSTLEKNAADAQNPDTPKKATRANTKAKKNASAKSNPVKKNAKSAEKDADPYAGYREKWDLQNIAPAPRWNLKSVCIGAVSVILALALCVGGFLLYRAKNEPAANALPSSEPLGEGVIVLSSVEPKAPEDAMSLPDIIEQTKPSIVGISVVGTDASTGVASGFIVSDAGYIITNLHVIGTPASVTVQTADGSSYPASLVGGDNLSDIAVLKIAAEGLTPITLGDSASVRAGDYVLAIGTPVGLDFKYSATFGILSGVDRTVQMKDEAGNVTKKYTVLQTDASINPGNSGGPLLNVYGQVIGINSLKLSTDSYEGIGFALPINGAIAVANQIIAKGRVSDRPENDYAHGATTIGASLKTYTKQDADANDLVPGAYVYTVAKDGPAEAAGIAMGDIITKFNGVEVKTVSDVTNALLSLAAGETVELEIYRARTTLTLSITLSEYTGD